MGPVFRGRDSAELCGTDGQPAASDRELAERIDAALCIVPEDFLSENEDAANPEQFLRHPIHPIVANSPNQFICNELRHGGRLWTRSRPHQPEFPVKPCGSKLLKSPQIVHSGCRPLK
ncbi:MAG: hypothetical protein DWQ34_14535 [Planctomycetota bacterium]|nr:MAG: hypothetical protein DWQ29_09280 [Planctomycetota bacterium]REJ91654.1 MAG: hypothetical protein DWQ34_14535 [Planctomycetota bacterium]REK19976.1 MAG: hypothetical protein DWQ41_27015 [Planctomycetota bacterium]REK27543.1 MAG: hypothetical protein DWQ45_26035 [Planctomycetota bacterium]